MCLSRGQQTSHRLPEPDMDPSRFWTPDRKKHVARQDSMTLTSRYMGLQPRRSRTQIAATLAQPCDQDSPHESSLSRGIGNSATPWTAEMDNILIKAHSLGMRWEQIHQVYFPHQSVNACRKRFGRLRPLSTNQTTAIDAPLSIRGLYSHALESLTQLVSSSTCAQCDEAGSTIELREMAAQLHVWAKGLDFLHLEKTVEHDTRLQVLVVRRLSNIADVTQRFLGYRFGDTYNSRSVRSLIQKYSHECPGADVDHDSTDSSDSESEIESSETPSKLTGPHRNHRKHLDSLNTSVTSLMNLLPTLDHCCQESYSPLSSPRVSQLRDGKQETTPANPFIIQIQDRFPLIAPVHAHRLGEANWNRFLRLRNVIAHSDYVDPASGRFWPSPSEEVAGISLEQPAVPSLFTPASQFNDSGLGSSRPKKSIYASSHASHKSMISTKSSAGRGAARVPPTPPEVSQGLPFNCKVCGRTLTGIRNRIDWKLHVFADLQPYICLDRDCKDEKVTFPTRKMWADHEFNEHWRKEVWQCFNCNTVLDTKEDLVDHCKALHGFDTLFPPSHRAMMLDGARTIVASGLGHTCPVCSQHHFETSQDYTAHVSRHMEEIALFALSQSIRSDDDDDDDEDDNNNTGDSDVENGLKKLAKIKVPKDGFALLDTGAGDSMINASVVHHLRAHHFYNLKDHSDPPLSDFLVPELSTSKNPLNIGPIRQSPHFDGDIYTPRYKRRNAAGNWEGWCGYCQPGRWLDLKNSRYWEDKLRNHGICARTKTLYDLPKRLRRIRAEECIWEGSVSDPEAAIVVDNDTIEKREGLCSECDRWIPMDATRSNGRGKCVLWYMHAYKCHEQSKSKVEEPTPGQLSVPMHSAGPPMSDLPDPPYKSARPARGFPSPEHLSASMRPAGTFPLPTEKSPGQPESLVIVKSDE